MNGDGAINLILLFMHAFILNRVGCEMLIDKKDIKIDINQIAKL